jgi:hypothetical protein
VAWVLGSEKELAIATRFSVENRPSARYLKKPTLNLFSKVLILIIAYNTNA